MRLFLTSSHTLGWAGPLNPANGLVDALQESLRRPIRCVMVSSFPDDKEITDRMAWEIRESFEWAGMEFAHYEVLDRRTARQARRMIAGSNFIVLCGGHVPTENRFFRETGLRELLKGYEGTLLTVSAGSMNCAGTVYSPPELEGEAESEDYEQYFPGLGLTDINIVPHYQDLRRAKVDGHRLVHELIAPCTYAHPVYFLPDGSFFIIEGDRTELRGKAYRMKDGRMRRINEEGERRLVYGTGWTRRLAD